ncbi:MAG: hypothetical protein DRN15_05115 [Thermoprotei archaeon]|nr:MAG: hypothetical protein DRN15_05115 [Thermoprotei archaeon]
MRMSFGPDVKSLIRKLIMHRHVYFSNGILNSEGRKVFEEMARMLVYEHPQLKKFIRRIRNRPTLDNIMKLAKLVLGDEAEALSELTEEWKVVARKYGLLIGDYEEK